MKAFLLIAVCLLVSLAESQKSCDYVVGEWSDCLDGHQERTIKCVCGEGEEDLAMCQDGEDSKIPMTEQECESMDQVCKWKWTRWTPCSQGCDGGNTTRSQVCMCEGDDVPAAMEYCDEFLFIGEEVAECNTFGCEEIPSFNKLYWIARADDGFWPMPDETFECSLGVEVNVSSPKGKHYSTILREEQPQTKPHPEWYYLAKEWIAAKLNVANGARLSPENLALVAKVGAIIEDCNGWTGKQLYDVYSAKEKLGRMNNNIGGLEHVDQQVAILAKSDGIVYDDEQTKSTIAMVVVIPCAAILVVLIIAGAVIYQKRQSRYLVVEKTEFESEDEEEPATDKAQEQPQAQPEVTAVVTDKPNE